MTNARRFLLAATLVLTPSLVTLAQISITPPPPPTPTASQPAATVPAEPILPMTTTPPTEKSAATAPASTLPSAQSVLEGLLNEKPAPAPTVSSAATNPALTPTVEGTAPAEPKAALIREGQMIWNRAGQLVKDEKTGAYFFEFKSDDKAMHDAPMGLLPSHFLMLMEDASNKGSTPMTFRVSGMVTEYRGKNYLLVQSMQQAQDLNQGIGR